MGHGDPLEAEGETESTDGKDEQEHSKLMSKQLGNMLGIQAHESKTDQELAEKGGRENTKEARKRHEAHIAKQNGENAEQLWLNKKKQEVVATVANNQRERLEEDVEVQSKLFSQDQGTQDVLVSSYKSAMKYSGDGEELTHRENGVRASGEEPEVQFFAFINCFNICSGKVIQIC